MNNYINKIKKLGRVFTPQPIVEFMLDCIEYKEKSLLKKHVLDNSCGDGVFLTNCVKRYLEVAKKEGMEEKEIRVDLETYVHGIEIDEYNYQKCLTNLNNIFRADYDIKNEDAFNINDYDYKMDFVVGNPPYVKIHNLKDSYKKIISEKKMKGMTNLYLLFYLLSFKQLNKNGKLIYLTPSFFKSSSSKFLRENIILEKKALHFYDFKHQQVFPNITTYPIISLFKNSSHDQSFHYSIIELKKDDNDKENIVFNYTNKLEWVKREWFADNKFIFNKANYSFSENINVFDKNKKKYLEVKNGFQTSSDGVFISDKFNFNSSNIINIFKSSTGEKKQCIFPYKYITEEGKYELINFPELDENIRNYLNKFRYQLENRSIKEKEKWWQFGRTQAINDLKKDRFYFNNLFNKEFNNIKLGFVSPDTGIYGGIYILLNEKIEEDELREIFHNERFRKFVEVFGEHKSGNYYLINSKLVEKYLNAVFYLKREKVAVVINN